MPPLTMIWLIRDHIDIWKFFLTLCTVELPFGTIGEVAFITGIAPVHYSWIETRSVDIFFYVEHCLPAPVTGGIPLS
jgi:hypothetical protein